MRTVFKVLAILVVIGAVAAGGYVVLSRRSDSETRATSGSRLAPTALPTTPPTAPPTTATTRVPGAPLPLDPRPTRMVWAGDSIAATLGDAIKAGAAAHGVEVTDRTISGCGMVRGLPADDTLTPISFVTACDGAIPPHQVDIANLRPEVVTWLSTWETANRVVDGQSLVFGTPEADTKLLELIDESAQRLMATGARLVILTMPPNTTGPTRPIVPEAEAQSAIHLDDLYRQYATAHADRVSILDLAALVCPGGPPCPTVVDGVTLRPVDGGHFADDGPGWVAARVLDQLLGP